MKQLLFILTLSFTISACGPTETSQPVAANELPKALIDELAREYVFLELSMGRHDEGHVDAYFGPEEIRQAADRADLRLAEIKVQVAISQTTSLLTGTPGWSATCGCRESTASSAE